MSMRILRGIRRALVLSLGPCFNACVEAAKKPDGRRRRGNPLSRQQQGNTLKTLFPTGSSPHDADFDGPCFFRSGVSLKGVREAPYVSAAITSKSSSGNAYIPVRMHSDHTTQLLPLFAPAAAGAKQQLLDISRGSRKATATANSGRQQDAITPEGSARQQLPPDVLSFSTTSCDCCREIHRCGCRTPLEGAAAK
ncbi:hypothetical protein cyc_06475 [Cyclospora cayetanensis]|uniref:Secreted protein n=1 Tax=Cyclospora cayetanensis TaxID=88456 RepID=A0A1D3D3H0_9EIME|nr:hypothetical protein cyc_06475 [Cyclospora cayetanensis]